MKEEIQKLNEVLEKIENQNNGFFLNRDEIMYLSFVKVHLLSVIENLKMLDK
mgnify:FL=1